MSHQAAHSIPTKPTFLASRAGDERGEKGGKHTAYLSSGVGYVLAFERIEYSSPPPLLGAQHSNLLGGSSQLLDFSPKLHRRD